MEKSNANVPISSVKYKICECGVICENDYYLQSHLKRKHLGETKKVKFIAWPNLPVSPAKDTPKTITNTISNLNQIVDDTKSDTVDKSNIIKIPWTALRKCDVKIVPKTPLLKAKIVFDDYDNEINDSEKPLDVEEMLDSMNNTKSLDTSTSTSNNVTEANIKDENSDEEFMVCQKVEKDGTVQFQEIKGELAESDIPPNQCKTCYKIFGTVHGRAVHQRRNKECSAAGQPGPGRPKMGGKVKCEICGEWRSKLAIYGHLNRHAGKRNYKCEYCPKAFYCKTVLQTHTRAHRGERPYACEQCPRRFHGYHGLYRHKQTHLGLRPFQCPRCDKTFTQKVSAQSHLKYVHLKLPDPYRQRRAEAAKIRRTLGSSKMMSSAPVIVTTATETDDFSLKSSYSEQNSSITPKLKKKKRVKAKTSILTENEIMTATASIEEHLGQNSTYDPQDTSVAPQYSTFSSQYSTDTPRQTRMSSQHSRKSSKHSRTSYQHTEFTPQYSQTSPQHHTYYQQSETAEELKISPIRTVQNENPSLIGTKKKKLGTKEKRAWKKTSDSARTSSIIQPSMPNLDTTAFDENPLQSQEYILPDSESVANEVVISQSNSPFSSQTNISEPDIIRKPAKVLLSNSLSNKNVKRVYLTKPFTNTTVSIPKKAILLSQSINKITNNPTHLIVQNSNGLFQRINKNTVQIVGRNSIKLEPIIAHIPNNSTQNSAGYFQPIAANVAIPSKKIVVKTLKANVVHQRFKPAIGLNSVAQQPISIEHLKNGIIVRR